MVVATVAAPKMTLETITPTIALEYLERMPKNRRLRQSRVDRLALDMGNGHWVPAASGPIRFNIDGELIDGQHRLWALAGTGMAIDFMVVRDVPKEGIYVIDTNRPRTLADALYMTGETREIYLSGAINFYASWQSTGIIQKLSSNSAISTNDALALFADNPGLRDAVVVAEAITRKLKGGPGRWGCMVYILNNIDQEDADAFFNQLVTGEDLNQASPILKLRSRLFEDGSSNRKLRITDYTALVLKAWNMWRSGQTSPRALTWRSGGANPEAYPVPS